MPNDSSFAKETLESLHPRILVLRHPFKKIFIWSHHEKSVVVDRKICYVGGIDICLGRFERNETYDLKEPLNQSKYIFIEETLFPGADYNNTFLKDFERGRNYQNSLIKKTSTPRMPWRDIQAQIVGEAAEDFVRNFIQYWNFVKFDNSSEKRKRKMDFVNGIPPKTEKEREENDLHKEKENLENNSIIYTQRTLKPFDEDLHTTQPTFPRISKGNGVSSDERFTKFDELIEGARSDLEKESQ